MTRTKFLCLLLCLALSPAVLPLRAQQAGFTLRGSVRDGQNQPVELASVVLNGSIGVQSRRDGSFAFSHLPRGTYQWQARFVGYETASGTIRVERGDERLDIRLKELSIGLAQVTVVAKQQQMGSVSRIDQEAIRHLQPKSVGDLLQLVPGHLTLNPNLNNLSQAYLREIHGNAANALGTRIVVDGTPLSNDANLEVLAPTKYGAEADPNGGGPGAHATAGRGTDLRLLSANNVESMEVVRGIPGVEHGNLNSGVVIVHTKSGHTPWEVKVQADPNSKLAHAGKGFRLSRGGALNFSTDWAQSWADTRLHYRGYERITASAGYSNQFGPLSLNVRGAFYTHVNRTRRDPQMLETSSAWKNAHTGTRLSLYGQYKNRQSFITSLKYNLSLQASRQYDWLSNWIYNPDGVITNTREEGLQEARFKRYGYQSAYTIESAPLNLYAQLVADKYMRLGKTNYTSLKWGLEYTYDGNRGDGMTYDEANPPQAMSSHTLRPRSYREVPALQTLSTFLSDHTALQLGTLRARLDAGLRVANLFLNRGKSGGNRGYLVAEPRLNASLNVLTPQNNALLDDLSLTGGFGLSNKMPPLLYLYPDKAYFDNVALGRWSEEEANRLALVTTTIVSSTSNPDLKPVRSRKWELGLSVRKRDMHATVTFFRERHTNELGFLSQPIWIDYPYFELPDEATSPLFDPTTQTVSYTLHGTPGTATRKTYTERLSWGMPANTTRSLKHGIEYTLDLGEWRPLRTRLNLTGAWFHIKRQDMTETWRNIEANTRLQQTNFYMVKMPAGAGSISDRVNTNFAFVTHIPAIKMVFTTTVQVVWWQSDQLIYEDEHGHSRYYQKTFADKDYMVAAPLGYYDMARQWHAWTAADAENPLLNIYMGRQQTYDLKRNIVRPWAMLCLRVTKELGKTGEISFLANNLTNTRKYRRETWSRSLYQLYPSMYFGAEVKLKF